MASNYPSDGIFDKDTPPGLNSPNQLEDFSPGNQIDQLSQSNANHHGGVHNPDHHGGVHIPDHGGVHNPDHGGVYNPDHGGAHNPDHHGGVHNPDLLNSELSPPNLNKTSNPVAPVQEGNFDVGEILSPLNFSLNDNVSDHNVMMVDTAKKLLIEPENISTSFQTLTPDSSLDKEFSGLTVPIQFSGENVVNIENIPHRILANNKELIPMQTISFDPTLFSVPKTILTHRFSIACHLMLVNLHFDPKDKTFSMEVDKLLGSDKTQLESLGPKPYTSLALQSRVLGDIFKEIECPQILVISKLIFHYLNCQMKDIFPMFQQQRLKEKFLIDGNLLVTQAISWTLLNNKKIYEIFLDQSGLPKNGSLIENILLFNSYLNAFLHRMQEIEKIVKIVEPLLQEFFSVQNSLELGPKNLTPSQKNAMIKKMENQKEEFLRQGKTLFL